jgi:hypothetical protein
VWIVIVVIYVIFGELNGIKEFTLGGVRLRTEEREEGLSGQQEKRMATKHGRWWGQSSPFTGPPPIPIGSAGNWAGPGQPDSSPSYFVPNEFGPAKPKWFLGRAVPARSIKTVVQPGPKPRRAFFGPCRLKPDPCIWPHKIKILQPYKVHNLLN